MNQIEEEVYLQADKTKTALARRLIANIRQQLDGLERVLNEGETIEPEELEALLNRSRSSEGQDEKSHFVDGIFNGLEMVGEDGQSYNVPPNYSSKSKLVEGDFMRLIITDGGKFIFKQKGPIERERTVGMLVKDEQTDGWCVVADGRKFCVLPAAVSFHRGDAGDDVVVLLPKNAPSKWAAVENIIKRDISAFG